MTTTNLALAAIMNRPIRQASLNAQTALANERAARALDRAHIAALKAVLNTLAEKNPTAVRAALEAVFEPAFNIRAAELGAADLLHRGHADVRAAALEAKTNTAKAVL